MAMVPLKFRWRRWEEEEGQRRRGVRRPGEELWRSGGG